MEGAPRSRYREAQVYLPFVPIKKLTPNPNREVAKEAPQNRLCLSLCSLLEECIPDPERDEQLRAVIAHIRETNGGVSEWPNDDTSETAPWDREFGY